MARVFEEPLVPLGPEPTETENAEIAAALTKYAERSNTDDFTALTEFFNAHQTSSWTVALLTNLGLEYYHTGRYSKALDSWHRACQLGVRATDLKGKALVDRALAELAYMYARIGQMTELEALLESAKHHTFSGPATEKIVGAREGLWNMKHRPEIAFRCGPFALQRIKSFFSPTRAGTELIHASASTVRGFSLEQVAELSQKLGLNFQMAFREENAVFVTPAVVHLKLNHFAALIRLEGDRYLLQDSTFGNDVWVTRAALDTEASGYFLIPSGKLAEGWRAVAIEEGRSVWGKGYISAPDPGPHGPCDPATPVGGDSCHKGDGDCKGLAVSRVHLMLVSLNIIDEPVGYTPPVGPAVKFVVRYNQRDTFQPSNFSYSNLGPKWTFDWLSYVTDEPHNRLSDVQYYIMGGGTRTFTGIAGNTYDFQQLDHTKLLRMGPSSYFMDSPDGTRKIFAEGTAPFQTPVGIKRKVFLSQIIDPQLNSVRLSYDGAFRMVALTDPIGQVTTISYDHPTDVYKITKVTDPFGRFATFDYDAAGRLIRITDVIGLVSEFTYDVDGADGSKSDFIVKLTTPYGDTTFAKTEDGTARSLETTYPNGDRDRVEFNQATNIGVPGSEAATQVPTGMETYNGYLAFRNTYYWNRIAYAAAYPDYTQAQIYHWLHGRNNMPDVNTSSGILESVKAPLEGRVWFDYAGSPQGPLVIGRTNKPAHVGRVLDDGSTQLYSNEYNGFGKITKQTDPVGRTFSYAYAANGIDLLEGRQTRDGLNEFLFWITYNSQHLPLTVTDARGCQTAYTYNAQGQVLTKKDSIGWTTSYHYDGKGQLTSIVGPLGPSGSFTYDAQGRMRTKTDDSGYALTFDYDDLDRLTTLTYPDGTFYQFSYKWLDLTRIRDRAGRDTTFEYDVMRQLIKRTDPLSRVTEFTWCKCGRLRDLIDPMRRTTSWRHDMQGRLKLKEYADGSKVTYQYENNSSRLSQRIDEKLQLTKYDYNKDNTIRRLSYNSATTLTPTVDYEYDDNFLRVRSMTDGIGTTRYNYVPFSGAPGLLASIDAPAPYGTTSFAWDMNGRCFRTAIDGVVSEMAFDAVGRVASGTNPLGAFTYTYDGLSSRVASITSPTLNAKFTYAGITEDKYLQKISNKLGSTLVSEFIYVKDMPTGQITSWSQQADTDTPFIHNFTYDLADQLTEATITKAGALVKTFGYSYDLAGNRVSEQIDSLVRHFDYNALNQLIAIDGTSPDAVCEWDAEDRLVTISSGTKRTEFVYDGLGRRVGIRSLLNGTEVSHRRFVWVGSDVREVRDAAGTVLRRFFDQGMEIESGSSAGDYVYSRDHLGSIREFVDSSAVRQRNSYDPFGRQTAPTGDVEGAFGFAGMFWSPDTELYLTRFRAYDPDQGRWLSRDPITAMEQYDLNQYFYVRNNPINAIDPYGDQTHEIPPPAPPNPPTSPSIPDPSPTAPPWPVPPPSPDPKGPTIPAPDPLAPTQPVPDPSRPQYPTIPRPPKIPDIPGYWKLVIICGLIFLIFMPFPKPAIP